jgi:putative protease
MRSLYYLATVIGTYREIIDRLYDNTLTEDKMKVLEYRLSRVANREVSTHYFTHEADFSDQYYTGRQELSNQDYLGLITGYDKDNKCLIMVERNYFEPNDEVEIFTPNNEIINYKVEEIFDEDMNKLDVARHPEQVLKLKFDRELPIYSMIRLIKKGK